MSKLSKVRDFAWMAYWTLDLDTDEAKQLRRKAVEKILFIIEDKHGERQITQEKSHTI